MNTKPVLSESVPTREAEPLDFVTAWQCVVAGNHGPYGEGLARDRVRRVPTGDLIDPTYETHGVWSSARDITNPSARDRIRHFLAERRVTLPAAVAEAWDRLDVADAALAALDLDVLAARVRNTVLDRAKAGESVTAMSVAGVLGDAVSEARTRALRHDLTTD